MGKRLAVVAAIVGAGRLASADPLTLDKAVDLALAHNERAGITTLDVTVAEAGVAKARASFLPVLSASGNDTYGPLDTKDKNTARGSLTLTQPLIAPSAWPLYSQAKHSLDAQQAQAVEDRRQLAFDTAKAYMAVLLADEVVQAAQKKLETAKADVDDTNAQVKAQLASSNDVTRANISLASSVRELAADQGNLDAAYVQLELLVAGPVSRPLASPTARCARPRRSPPTTSRASRATGCCRRCPRRRRRVRRRPGRPTAMTSMRRWRWSRSGASTMRVCARPMRARVMRRRRSRISRRGRSSGRSMRRCGQRRRSWRPRSRRSGPRTTR
jgi:outer membrane protein TolC